MNKETGKTVVNETPSKQQALAVKEKEKKVKETDGVFLPVLVEFTFAISAIVLSILFLTVISISLLTGAKLLDIVIRTSVTILLIGGLLILISRQISLDVVNSTIAQEEEAKQKESETKESEQAQPDQVQLNQTPPYQMQSEFTQSEELDGSGIFEREEPSKSEVQ